MVPPHAAAVQSKHGAVSLLPGRQNGRGVMKRSVVVVRATSSSFSIDSPRPYGKGAERRVVITGHGVVSSLGHDPEEFYSNLLDGKSGISQIESFDACMCFQENNSQLLSFLLF